MMIMFLLNPGILSVSGQTKGSAAFYNLISRGITIEATNRDSAMVFYRQAISPVNANGIDTAILAGLWVKISRFEYYRGNTEIAIKLAFSAYDYARRIKNRREITRLQVYIADILRGNNLYDQSYHYLELARENAIDIKDALLYAAVANRLAANSVEDERLPRDTALKYGMKALEEARRAGSDSLIYSSLNILGAVYAQQNLHVKAIECYSQAYKIAEKAYPDDLPLILTNQARSWFNLNDLDRSEELNLKAIDMAMKSLTRQYIRLSAMTLSNIYIKKNDFRNALKYATIYYQTKEFILTQKVQVQLQEFNNRISEEKQLSENRRLIYEQTLTGNKLKFSILAAIMLLVVMAVLVGFLIHRQTQKKKTEAIAKQLEQTNVTLRRFISILAHDLRSPFTAILGFSDMLKNDRSLSEEDREMAIDSIYKVGNSTFLLLERLLEWSRIQSGSLTPVKMPCDITLLIRDSIAISEPTAVLKKIRINLIETGPLPVVADADMLLAIFRNIISNAVKFTGPGGLVEIRTNLQENFVQIMVSDCGVGINPENLPKLFNPAQNYKSLGTMGEGGTGLGLILCHEYMRLHNGKISVDSTPGEGTTFTIKLPR